MRSALEQYQNENVPLWHWILGLNGFAEPILSYYALAGSERSRIGALSAMRVTFSGLPPDFERGAFLKEWLSGSSTDLKIAALSYLGECGNESDVEAIRGVLADGDNRVVAAASEAVIRISLSKSRESAIQVLYDLQPTHIPRRIIEKLFLSEVSLATEVLLKGVEHQSVSVREVVVRSLYERNELQCELAEKLLQDESPEVRFFAIKALARCGRRYSDAEAKEILVKQSRGYGLGLLSRAVTTGEKQLEQFRRDMLVELSSPALEELAREGGILSPEAGFVLIEREFGRRGDELRAALDNLYAEEFRKELDKMRNVFGGEGRLLEQMRSLEEHLRKKLTRQGLDIVGRKKDQVDLVRVRRVLDSGFVDYSDLDIAYLSRCGNWDDVPRIVSIVQKMVGSGVFYSEVEKDTIRKGARALYKVGRSKFSELVRISMPTSILVSILKEASVETLAKVTREVLLELLHSTDDTVRRVVVLKIVHAKSKAQTKGLLGLYMNDDRSRYYNVIHWLDFGVSAPREIVKRASEECLRTMDA